MIKALLLRVGILSTCGFLSFANPGATILSTDAGIGDEEVLDEEEEEEPLYSPGDMPYTIKKSGFVFGYLIVHADYSYENVDKETFDAFCVEYANATGQAGRTINGRVVTPDSFIQEVQSSVFEVCASEEEAITRIALYIDDMSYFPDKSQWKIFNYNEETWYTFYKGDVYYYTDEDTYNCFLSGGLLLYDENMIPPGDLGCGYLNLNIIPSISVVDDSFYVELESDRGDIFDLLVNPPTFVSRETLQAGTYKVVKAGLYTNVGYPLEVDKTEFTIIEGEECNVQLTISDLLDTLDVQPYDEDLMKAANETAGGTTIDPSTISSNVADFQPEPEPVVIEEPKNTNLELIILAIIGGIVVIGGILFIVIKKNTYEDDD